MSRWSNIFTRCIVVQSAVSIVDLIIRPLTSHCTQNTLYTVQCTVSNKQCALVLIIGVQNLQYTMYIPTVSHTI